jgi:hypothetical protein
MGQTTIRTNKKARTTGLSLHLIACFVVLPFAPVFPANERLVDSAKLQIIPDRLFFLCKSAIFLLGYDLVCFCVVHRKFSHFYGFAAIIVESGSYIPCYKTVERCI